MYPEEVTTETKYNRFKVIGKNGEVFITTERKMTTDEVLETFDQAVAVQGIC